MNDVEFRRKLLATFQLEAADHLRALNRDVSLLQQAADPQTQAPLLESLFRQTHTLKGAARMVGEFEAESLCHALERQLAELKAVGALLPPGSLEETAQAVAAIAASLQLAPTTVAAEPELPSSPAPVGNDSPTASPAAATVRVSGGNLDTLLLRAEELAAHRLSTEQQASALAALRGRGQAWQRELDRGRRDLGVLRRFVDANPASPIARELVSLLNYFDWTHEFVRELHGDVTGLSHHAANDHRRLSLLVDNLLDDAKELLMQPFASVLQSIPGFVREVAEQQQKQIEVAITGSETEIDRRVLDEVKDILLHLVRNCVDHGIEPAAERRAQGKAERGSLSIAVAGRAGGTVAISVADDGRGIAPDEVLAHAKRLRLVPDSTDELSPQQIFPLLFHSGFSTRTEATDLSGRGLGLAIVREKAERLGGSVTLESERGRGTTFHIRVPLTLARFRGVFVQVQQQTFVLPASYVRRVLRVRRSELRSLKDRQLVDLEGEAVVLASLEEAIGMPRRPRAAGDDLAFVVVLQAGRLQAALRIDDIPHEQEVVMKAIGTMLRGARQYIGATVVGGGRVIPVLNVGHVLEVACGTTAARTTPGTSGGAPSPRAPSRRTVLVVEDSITSRSLLKGILQTAGYQVRTAVDGMDALTVLKFEAVDLVITDVQMPRLDGFELTDRLRRDPAFSGLPVVLITSLASREDRERGVAVGANAYIVKSSFDQSDLLATLQRLLP